MPLESRQYRMARLRQAEPTRLCQSDSAGQLRRETVGALAKEHPQTA